MRFFFLDQLYLCPKSGCCSEYSDTPILPAPSTISSSQRCSFLDFSLFLSIPVSGENVTVLKIHTVFMLGLPWRLSGERIHLQCGRHRFDPWVRKILQRNEWQPTSVFMPGESHGPRSLVGYTPGGCKESNTT